MNKNKCLSSESDSRIGCWNVRTSLYSGSQSLIAPSLARYRVDVACISEHRLGGNGALTYHLPDPSCDLEPKLYHLLFSGNSEQGHGGVGFLLSPKVHATVLEWQPHSPRIARVRLSGKYANLTLISVYAPTNEAPDAEKDDFYDCLHQVLRGVPSKDVLLIGGDLNAQIGPRYPGEELVVGNFSLGVITETA